MPLPCDPVIVFKQCVQVLQRSRVLCHVVVVSLRVLTHRSGDVYVRESLANCFLFCSCNGYHSFHSFSILIRVLSLYHYKHPITTSNSPALQVNYGNNYFKHFKNTENLPGEYGAGASRNLRFAPCGPPMRTAGNTSEGGPYPGSLPFP